MTYAARHHSHNCLLAAAALQVLFVDHVKATDCEEQILEVNAVPAAHSKCLLLQPHPGNTPTAMATDASQQQGAADSDLSDDEVAEAADQARGVDQARAADTMASKL
jgi:hypothetical protein